MALALTYNDWSKIGHALEGLHNTIADKSNAVIDARSAAGAEYIIAEELMEALLCKRVTEDLKSVMEAISVFAQTLGEGNDPTALRDAATMALGMMRFFSPEVLGPYADVGPVSDDEARMN